MPPPIELLTPEMLPELSAFWKASFPLQPMNEAILRERVFGPEDAAPERSLLYRGEDREIIALSLIAPPDAAPEGADPGWGGLRAFGVHPAHRKRGLGTALMEESCVRLREIGASSVGFLTTPPFYIQPGVDTRATDVIAWLLRRGFERTATHFNMTVNLGAQRFPTIEEILRPDASGYEVRRATAEDLPAFRKHCVAEWTDGWMREAAQAVAHEPSSLFLAIKGGAKGKAEEEKEEAERGETIVGFAAYEVNQCVGSFGPTGVAPAHQGRGVGRRLLLAALIDMKSLGRSRCEIGWIGPADFYHRHAGATIGPAFWAMRKTL